MAVVEKPSRVTQIPVAPGIRLENLIQFDGDCIDPLALIVIIESLDYALETSARRLESLGKIFSGVEESAYTGGHGILPTIKAIREAFLQAPQCTPSGPKVQPPPISPEEAIVAEAKRRTEELAKPPKPKVTPSAKEKVVSRATPEAVFETTARELAEAKRRTEELAKPPKPTAKEKVVSREKAKPPAKKTEIEAMLETLPKEIRETAEAEYKKLKEKAEVGVPESQFVWKVTESNGSTFFSREPVEVGQRTTGTLFATKVERVPLEQLKPIIGIGGVKIGEKVAAPQIPVAWWGLQTTLTKEVWEKTPVEQRAINARFVGLSGVVGSKGWEALTAEEKIALAKAVRPKPVPKITLTKEQWEKRPITQRTLIARAVGLTGKVGSKPWAALTESEKVALSHIIPAKRIKVEEEPSKKERELPGLWGKAYFKGEGKEAGLTGEYESPGALAEALGISTRGAKDTPTAFRRAGFEIRGDGETVEKGKTGFIVKRVSATPKKYQRVEEAAEFIAPGKAVLPISAERVPVRAEYPQPWQKTAIGWKDAEGKDVPPAVVQKAFRE